MAEEHDAENLVNFAGFAIYFILNFSSKCVSRREKRLLHLSFLSVRPSLRLE
jgi:hypothetical protein